jgi:hypothetical protein
MAAFLLFAIASMPTLEPNQSPIKQVPGTFTPGVKWPGSEATPSLPSTAEVKNAWSYTSSPQYVFIAPCVVKLGDFTLLLQMTS